jgi:hypothetical protein
MKFLALRFYVDGSFHRLPFLSNILFFSIKQHLIWEEELLRLHAKTIAPLLGYHCIEYKDTQNNDSQHNASQHNYTRHNNTQKQKHNGLNLVYFNTKASSWYKLLHQKQGRWVNKADRATRQMGQQGRLAWSIDVHDLTASNFAATTYRINKTKQEDWPGP